MTDYKKCIKPEDKCQFRGFIYPDGCYAPQSIIDKWCKEEEEK